eukprot:5739037-Alexandrium_andersonii.AAC.1
MLRKKATDFPMLKATAAESRALLFALELLCTKMPNSSDRDQHRLAALAALANMYRVFTRNDTFLPATEAEKAVEYIDTFLLHYTWLTRRALSRGECLYHFT